MKKYGKLLFVLMIFSLLLAACTPKEGNPGTAAQTGNNPTVNQPAGAFVPNMSGEATLCTLRSLLPEVPAGQAPPIPLSENGDWVKGSLNAEVSIIEYSDFQCPYCAQAKPQLEKFYNDHADKVNLIFRNLPLISIHPNAMAAHRAAEAAGVQEKFFEMHDLLFDNQQAWSGLSGEDTVFDYFLGLAKQLKLDEKEFTEDYNSQEIINKITTSYIVATENLGITATPTVFIVLNGIPYGATYDYNTLSSILKLAEMDKNRFMECPPMIVDKSKTYEATISTTKGDIVVDLYPDKAPLTVNSFVFLANQGFYNNVEFHRVIPGFVAQVGDPSGLGIGGPGYMFANEISDLKFDSEGVLGMANSGADTNGSQFFITYAAQSALDGGYTVFGKVVSGMDVAKNLAAVDPQQGIKPANLDKIISITIREK